MDVMLNDDGTVQAVKVIEGDSLLSSAAIDAVKQWKYKPLKVNGELVNKVVVCAYVRQEREGALTSGQSQLTQRLERL